MPTPLPALLDHYEDQLDRSITALIFQVARNLGTAIDRRMAPFNITGQQAALLLRSCVVSNQTPSQLAPWLGTDNAGITRLLDRLEAKGFIVRRMSVTDRRAIVVEPTEAGRALVPHLVPAFRAVVAQLLDGFAEEERPLLESLLRRLLDNVEMCEHGDGHD